MTTIYHYTRPECLPKILESGVLELEGFNIERLVNSKNFKQLPNADKILEKFTWQKKSYKHTGRYVWFTEEEKQISCNSSDNQLVKLEFDSEELDVFMWKYACLVKRKNKKSRPYIDALNQSACNSGDDITKWWCSKKPINIKELKHFKIYKGEKNAT